MKSENKSSTSTFNFHSLQISAEIWYFSPSSERSNHKFIGVCKVSRPINGKKIKKVKCKKLLGNYGQNFAELNVKTVQFEYLKWYFNWKVNEFGMIFLFIQDSQNQNQFWQKFSKNEKKMDMNGFSNQNSQKRFFVYERESIVDRAGPCLKLIIFEDHCY